jgi:hypothetical protein
MKQHKYDSEMILSTSYDEFTGTLIVKYSDTAKFAYYHVPLDIARALERAKSPGRYWNARRTQFNYRRIT